MEQPEVTPEAPQVQPAKPHHLKRYLLIAGVVVGAFALLNMGIWGMYNARAYPGVKVGGQDVSNLDASAITTRLGSYTHDYKLAIVVKGQPQEVIPGDVDLVFEQQKSAQDAISKGKTTWLPLYGLIDTWQKGGVELRYRLNEEKLTQVAAKLAGASSVSPTDAKVVVEGETVRVEGDKPGQGVDPKRLAAVIKDKIAKGEHQASMSEQSTEAAVTTEEATAMVEPVQKALKLPITITVNGRVFTPGAAEIGKWLTVSPDKEGKLVLGAHQEAVNAYVATVAGQVDVLAVNKKINMVNGVVKTVSEGKNGSALDKAAASAALTKAVTSSQDTAVTGVMGAVAFKTLTNNTIDLNGKYIEINLSRQHLWAYQDKKLVYDTAITSGATGAGFATIQGLFSVKAKQTNRNLNGVPLGYNYNVFVKYWMPFSGNYGMHDASWRTSFGGSDYYYGGSHGCVNLPAAAAAWVFNFVIVGTPVWVHS